MRLFLALLAALLAGALSGCDFTPTLDVPLPEFEPALTLNGVLAADSTVQVRIVAAVDPYGHFGGRDVFDVPEGTVAELFRGGVSLGPLRLDSERCRNTTVSPQPGPGAEQPTFECGPFVSDVVIEPGATYTLRASAPGYPTVEATVTVPARVPVTLDVGPPVESEIPGYTRIQRDVTLSFRDPARAGDRYALLAVSGPWTYEDVYQTCDPGGCRDTTVYHHVSMSRFSYTTSDPVLLAAARTIPSNGFSFVTFTDEAFDGQARSFDIRVTDLNTPGREPEAEFEAVWLVAVDDATFGAYQIAWFGYPAGDDFNPFQEPLNLPSNVVGGYGVLGAVTVNAAPVE